jgi:hypothetical protein
MKNLMKINLYILQDLIGNEGDTEYEKCPFYSKDLKCSKLDNLI